MSKPVGKPLTYLLAFLAGIAGAVAGWIVTGFFADFLLGLSGMSDREGYRAMVAFFTFGPLGALAGLTAGIGLVLRYHGGVRTAAGLAGRGAMVAASIVAAVALGLWAYSLSDDTLVRNGPPPLLHFEIRLPESAALPPDGVAVDLNTDKNTMPATVTALTEGGREVLKGRVELYFRTARRLLVLRVPGEPDRLFLLRLSADPKASEAFGDWQRVDEVADGPEGDLRKGNQQDNYEIRYRVERSM